MHWTIAAFKMDLNESQSLSDNVKLAYKSGCLLADIGAALMDHYKDFDTDSYGVYTGNIQFSDKSK